MIPFFFRLYIMVKMCVSHSSLGLPTSFSNSIDVLAQPDPRPIPAPRPAHVLRARESPKRAIRIPATPPMTKPAEVFAKMSSYPLAMVASTNLSDVILVGGGVVADGDDVEPEVSMMMF